MAQIPLLVHIGAAAEAAPLLAAAIVRRSVRGARAWVLAWCGVLVVFDAAELWLALRNVHNVWLIRLFPPVSGALVLWALSCWQPREMPRLTLRFAIVPFLLLWAVLTLAVEDASTFSRAADPMVNLVCLIAAAFTLVVRSHASSGELLGQDWFWVSAGMALFFGTWSMVAPLSAVLVGDNPGLMAGAYEVVGVLQVAAFLAIARGVTCPAAT